jgi:hypothetical protein
MSTAKPVKALLRRRLKGPQNDLRPAAQASRATSVTGASIGAEGRSTKLEALTTLQRVTLFGAPRYVKVFRVGIGAARSDMPKMVRESARGKAFLIANSRNPDDEGALLISPTALEKALHATKPRRTLGDILRALPLTGADTPRLIAAPLLSDTLPQAHLPD